MDSKFNNDLIQYMLVDGEPWLRGNDIAINLKYYRPSNAIRDHIPNKLNKPLRHFTSKSINWQHT